MDDLEERLRNVMADDCGNDELCVESRIEIARLKQVLLSIEFMTATANGLSSSECINVHLLAAEGRSDEPQAWRLDPNVVKQIHEVVERNRTEGQADG